MNNYENLINFRRKDAGKLSYAIRKFNEKIRELEGLEREFAPDELDYKKVKSQIASRREFNRVIKALQRFTRSGQENIVKLDSGENISKWERHELMLSQRRAENYLTSELMKEANLPRNIFGMKSDRYRQLESLLESISKLEKSKGSEYKRIKERVFNIGTTDKELRRAKVYKDNFLSGLKDKQIKNFKNYELFMNYIKNKLKNPLKFFEKMNSSEIFANFFQWYSSKQGTLVLSGFATNEDAFNLGLEELGILK